MSVYVCAFAITLHMEGTSVHYRTDWVLQFPRSYLTARPGGTMVVSASTVRPLYRTTERSAASRPGVCCNTAGLSVGRGVSLRGSGPCASRAATDDQTVSSSTAQQERTRRHRGLESKQERTRQLLCPIRENIQSR